MSLYSSLLYFITGILLLATGLTILLKDRKSLITQSLFAFCLSTIFWMLSIYLGYYFVDPISPNLSTFFIRIAFLFGLFMTGSLVSFAYSYPQKSITYSRWIVRLFFGVMLFTSLLSTFTPLVYKAEIIVNGNEIEDIHGVLHSLYLFHYLFNCFVATAISIKKLKNSQGIERNKIILSLIGILSVLLPIILFHTTLSIFGIYLLQTEVVLFSLVFVALIFYSMQKYRLLNISHVSFNILRKLILFSFFIIISLVFHKGLDSLLPNQNDILIEIISYSIGIFCFLQARQRFPEFIGPSFRHFKNTIRELHVKIYACEEYKQLQDALEHSFLVSLNTSLVQIFALRDKDEKEKISIPAYYKDDFSEKLVQFKGDVLSIDEIDFREIQQEDREIFRSAMQNLQATLCFPLFAEDRLIGFLNLGQKGNKEIYTKEEIDEMLLIIPVLEVVFMNIILKENLQAENSMMKEVVRKKTQELKQQYDAMETLAQQQADFITIASHEVRTPLSITMFQIEDLLESYQHPQAVLLELKEIVQGLQSLKILTEKLFCVQQFDLNKIEITKKPVLIHNFIKAIHKEFVPLMKESSIDFSFESSVGADAIANIDKAQLKQVIHNLLGNARKFVPPGSKVILSVFQKWKILCISVADSGKGVIDAEKEKVFEKFATIKVAEARGLGLGLYLCKKIITLHDGNIFVQDSQRLGGAEFMIELLLD